MTIFQVKSGNFSLLHNDFLIIHRQICSQRKEVRIMARRGENIYKRKDGRYEGRYIKYYDTSGKAVYGYIYSKNYADIKEQLAKCKTEKQLIIKGSNTLLCTWIDVWLNSQGTLKPTTKRIYKSHIENHINPKIGNIQLKRLNTEILQNFINDLELSSSTTKTIFSTLKSALRVAEDKGNITNVWSKVKLPKKEKAFVRILSASEQQLLEKYLITDEDIGIIISLYAGLRIGEVCALKWSDINFESAFLMVNGTQARTEKGIEITSPKSKTSKREIPLPPFLISKLKEIPHKCDFVLSRKCKPFDVRTYRRHFKEILKKAKLPDIKYHSLRHSFSTRALETGMDYKTLSELLGHSSVGITLDLYAHSLKEHKIKQINKLGKLFNS